MTQEEILAILRGWLAVDYATFWVVQKTVHVALGRIQSEITQALEQVNRAKAEMLVCQEDLKTAIQYAQESVQVQWRSQAATVFKTAVGVQVGALMSVVLEHQELMNDLEQAASALKQAQASLTPDHPAVVGMAAGSLGSSSVAMAIGGR